jgi:hypothetical protein
VGCVDTRAARATIRDAVGNWSTVSYWLDVGNNADSGQFILGGPPNDRNRRSRLRLRSAAELYPEIVDASLDNEGEPSCSAIEALERQEPFINSTLVLCLSNRFTYVAPPFRAACRAKARRYEGVGSPRDCKGS